MSDPLEHSHSDSAYSVLDEFVVGQVGTEETIVDPNYEFTDDWKPEDTDNGKDWEKNQFLDLEKPLIMQVWNAEFSKAFYLQQVHQPRFVLPSLPSFPSSSFFAYLLSFSQPPPRFSPPLRPLVPRDPHHDVVVRRTAHLAPHHRLHFPPIPRPTNGRTRRTPLDGVGEVWRVLLAWKRHLDGAFSLFFSSVGN